MKKILGILMVMMIMMSGMAQLQVQTVEEFAGYKTLYEIKYLGYYNGEIRYIEGSGYILFGRTNNQFEDHMASIFLGKTKDAAAKTIADLAYFYKNANSDTYIVKGYDNKNTKIILGEKRENNRLIQIETDGIAGLSGVVGWVVGKDDIYAAVLHAIYQSTYSD